MVGTLLPYKVERAHVDHLPSWGSNFAFPFGRWEFDCLPGAFPFGGLDSYVDGSNLRENSHPEGRNSQEGHPFPEHFPLVDDNSSANLPSLMACCLSGVLAPEQSP